MQTVCVHHEYDARACAQDVGLVLHSLTPDVEGLPHRPALEERVVEGLGEHARRAVLACLGVRA